MQDKVNQNDLNWLTRCPASDLNFRNHLKQANAETIKEALKDKALTKTAINLLNAELKRKEKQNEKN